jgi:hypothetical protein
MPPQKMHILGRLYAFGLFGVKEVPLTREPAP